MPRSFRLALIGLVLALLVSGPLAGCQRPPGPVPGLHDVIGPYRFGVLEWKARNLLGIGRDRPPAPPDWALERADAELVLAYFGLESQRRALENRLWRGAGGGQDNAGEVRAALESVMAERAALRDRVEAILARQVRDTLAREGIHHPFQSALPVRVVFPPVAFRLDRPPTLLVVSPRDRIARLHDAMLIQDMPVELREEIEDAVAALGYSALVIDLGGLAVLYPTLIDNRGSLAWTLDTIIHEWLHQYLAFTPLGWRYVLDVGGLRRDRDIAAMNESVADLLGRELGRRVLEEYYPEAVAPQPAPAPAPSPDRSVFNRTMRETRLRVDALLAAGQIDEAEAHMEERRLFLASEGYRLRKLNQAYFAFHGAYATAPTSVDPIGDELRALRWQAESPREFLLAAQVLTSRAELQAQLERAVAIGAGP